MRLHLCCGSNFIKGWTNVDARDFGQEVVADINDGWFFAGDETVCEIYCKDGFEHFESAEHFLKESSRCIKSGGLLRIWVPHYKNPSAYRLTNKRLMSWSYFDAFQEPHDAVQTLHVISNKIYIGHKNSRAWHMAHYCVNLIPKCWERVAYVSNIKVVL